MLRFATLLVTSPWGVLVQGSVRTDDLEWHGNPDTAGHSDVKPANPARVAWQAWYDM